MTRDKHHARITDKSTTTIASQSRVLRRIIVVCSNAGTSWTLRIQDKAGSPAIALPSLTLAVPSDGKPLVVEFEQPGILMEGGIEIVTGGTTAGVVDVWIVYGDQLFPSLS